MSITATDNITRCSNLDMVSEILEKLSKDIHVTNEQRLAMEQNIKLGDFKEYECEHDQHSDSSSNEESTLEDKIQIGRSFIQ